MSTLEHDSGATKPTPQPAVASYENRLIEVRLGIASSLVAALRQKHAPAASHSLRVALGCSSWATAVGLPHRERDELEVAALLHDLGKIGAPDRLLLKPGPLDLDEGLLMDQYRLGGLEILAHCCPQPGIVNIIRHSATWFDGSRAGYPLAGKQIPGGARMLAIVDAFDSMTTDQVYRPALSRERALHELFEHAGSQFDPDLVTSFSELNQGAHLHQQAISHWLKTLDPRKANQFWNYTPQPLVPASVPNLDALFQQKLFDNMFDAVIFIDSNLKITRWNRGAERLTGLSGESVLHRNWEPTLLGMRGANDERLVGNDCPVNYCISSGVQSLRRLQVRSGNKTVTVDVHTVPVSGPDGVTHGAAMLLHDASPQATLEEQCNNLHERATKDPLTQVANRSEFDRLHHLFVSAHLECQVPCSLIICDVDHFKSINDNHGHPAGDEALKSFAQVLKSECRSGDVVARYGGEEFVILCANCNNASATQRAEHLRRLISERPQPALDGNAITASFGVTEVQPGDTAESMLRRADRALLEAKRVGRNTVIQFGDGLLKPDTTCEDGAPAAQPAGELMLERVLISSVPLTMAVEKLRGFVLDHHAEILGIKADRIDLLIDAAQQQPMRRRSDRPVPLLVQMQFAEERVTIRNAAGQPAANTLRTRVLVSIRLNRTRDRRNAEVMLQASAILAAIQSYLMATPETASEEEGSSRRAVNMLAPWLKLRS